MNEPKNMGRPRKHLESEHHFLTSAEAAVAGAPPADAEVDQMGASIEETQSSAPVEHIEAIVGNPTFAPDVGMTRGMTTNSLENLNNMEKSSQSVENAITDGNGLQSQESPIEESIHVLVEQERVSFCEPQSVKVTTESLNGWHSIDTDMVMEHPPRNGMPVRLSRISDGDGVLAYWKRSRTFANSTKRWQEVGNWYNFNTSVRIDFEPKYWKERF